MERRHECVDRVVIKGRLCITGYPMSSAHLRMGLNPQTVLHKCVIMKPGKARSSLLRSRGVPIVVYPSLEANEDKQWDRLERLKFAKNRSRKTKAASNNFVGKLIVCVLLSCPAYFRNSSLLTAYLGSLLFLHLFAPKPTRVCPIGALHSTRVPI